MRELLGYYKNGNCRVAIYDDGTKVRTTTANEFCPEYPESIDLKITNCCSMGCPMCHEGSCPEGEHGDILHLPFIDTLHPFTEVAIGGGDPMTHPEILNLLTKLRGMRIIPNLTVHAASFLEHYNTLRFWADHGLIFGLGVSITGIPDQELIEKIKWFPNAVIHVIAGLVSDEVISALSDHDLKMLILGYKVLRRGADMYYSSRLAIDENIEKLGSRVMSLSDHFQCISFDNLALKQLKLQEKMTPAAWSKFYMGDDGQFTMYVDAVKKEFAVSSTKNERYPLMDNIDDMFAVVREKSESA